MYPAQLGLRVFPPNCLKEPSGINTEKPPSARGVARPWGLRLPCHWPPAQEPVPAILGVSPPHTGPFCQDGLQSCWTEQDKGSTISGGKGRPSLAPRPPQGAAALSFHAVKTRGLERVLSPRCLENSGPGDAQPLACLPPTVALPCVGCPALLTRRTDPWTPKAQHTSRSSLCTCRVAPSQWPCVPCLAQCRCCVSYSWAEV